MRVQLTLQASSLRRDIAHCACAEIGAKKKAPNQSPVLVIGELGPQVIILARRVVEQVGRLLQGTDASNVVDKLPSKSVLENYPYATKGLEP